MNLLNCTQCVKGFYFYNKTGEDATLPSGFAETYQKDFMCLVF